MIKRGALTKRAVGLSMCVILVALMSTLATGLILSFLTRLDSWLITLLSVFSGLLFSALTGYFVEKTFTRQIIKPISDLRDAAVKIAGGELGALANTHAAGELGELGKAVNNLAYQLSLNMYDLILERNKLKLMVDNLQEGVIAVDAEGKLTHKNPAVDKLMSTGARVTEARLHRLDDGRVWEDFKRVIETGENFERTIEVEDRTIHIAITSLIDEIGVTAGAVGMFNDITQQERLERTRRDYVANVSHEMRTPLTAVRALIEPLKEGMVKDEEARMRYYDIILREVTRLTRLISDLMELSRLQSGTLSISKSYIHLDDLVYDVCEKYSAMAKENGLAFNVPDDLANLPAVYANSDRVEQLLVILLDNAIKYTQEGGISVLTKYDDKKVTIGISDTGVGIAEKDLPYIFDRFYKVDKAHSGKGSGLGLSIASELCSWMGETLEVHNNKGGGTTFSFTLTRDEPKE